MYGGLRFFQRQEVKHALAYLRLAANADDDTAFSRVVNFPPRGIGARSIEQLQEAAQAGLGSGYGFANDMLRDVVYTEAGDARRRLYHRRALEILEAAGDSAAVLAHHAQAAGLMQPAFRHSLVAGREALRLSAVSEAIVHFDAPPRQFVHEGALPEMPEKVNLHDLYLQLGRAYELGGQNEKALAIAAERDRLGQGR